MSKVLQYDPVNDTSSWTSAPVTPPVASGRLVALGDSITVYADTALNYTMIWPSMLCWLSQGRLQYTKNAGVSGNTTTQMLARFDTDVTPYAPHIVTVMGGTNDVIGGTITDATSRANIKAIVAKILAIGAVPLLFTIPPFNGSAAQQQRIQTFNAWLFRYGIFNGIRVVDAYSVLVDPATAGNYLAAMTVDSGVHPTVAGHAAIAQAAFQVLYPAGISGGPLGLVSANLDATNLVPNGLFLTAGSGGLPANWALDSAPTAGTVTPSQITDTLMPGGKAQRFTLAAASGQPSGAYYYNTAGFSPGDVLLVAVAVNIQCPGGFAEMQLATGGGAAIIGYVQSNVQGRQVLRREITLPAGTTAIEGFMDVASAIGTAVSGTIDFGGFTVRNLTTGSMVTP